MYPRVSIQLASIPMPEDYQLTFKKSIICLTVFRAAPEEHVGLQHAFRCEMIHESGPIDWGLIPQWLAWTAIIVASVLFIWVVFRLIRCICRIHRTKKSNKDHVAMLQQMLP